jgi:hypothetical protein
MTAARRFLGGMAICFVLVSAVLFVAPHGASVARGSAPELGRAFGHATGAVHPAGVSPSASTNWAGYVVPTSNAAVTSVSGTFVVPKFHGTCGGYYNFSAASFWVGMDGWNSNTVEQTGVSIECYAYAYVGVVTYYGWYEFYPAGTVVLSMTISPGDTVSAKVSYSSSSYAISLHDLTNGNAYTNSFSGVTANRSSAEWIAEAPYSSGVLPLVNFGSISFAKSTAVISGSSHPISYYSSYEVTMVNGAGTADKAVPGALNVAGKGFKVTWKSYGP